ncbi:FUSC family protein [Streptomyces sp. NBC_00820]|uniref:hypothetical protein n=1 Tax=Streptomyces sp. NBC_00820 TaxID=2975842 RepID=UPI002ED60A5E|nr:FUSC family protein [Streptomyces sp. NBC_00820]
MVLFSVIAPEGWRLGLVRIEDVALGCAVSLVVGLLFRPRGAAAALGRVLCEAFSDGAQHLRGAVVSGLRRCDGPGAAAAAPAPASGDYDRRRASASARRLDAAFREYLAERGTKHLALADVTALGTRSPSCGCPPTPSPTCGHARDTRARATGARRASRSSVPASRS